MRHLSFLLAFLAASSAATVEAQTPTHSMNDFYRYIGPDVDLQGGLGYQYDTTAAIRNTVLGFGRLRMGAMWIPTYPWVFSVGPTVELNTSTLPVWGTQVEVMNFGAGLWLRGGVGLDYSAHPHFNAALGWSLVGVELNGFSAGPYDTHGGVAVLATVRIPIGFLGYVLSRH